MASQEKAGEADEVVVALREEAHARDVLAALASDRRREEEHREKTRQLELAEAAARYRGGKDGRGCRASYNGGEAGRGGRASCRAWPWPPSGAAPTPVPRACSNGAPRASSN